MTQRRSRRGRRHSDVRFVSHYGIARDFCHANGLQPRVVVEGLVRWPNTTLQQHGSPKQYSSLATRWRRL
jgi:hypothetical protein